MSRFLEKRQYSISSHQKALSTSSWSRCPLNRKPALPLASWLQNLVLNLLDQMHDTTILNGVGRQTRLMYVFVQVQLPLYHRSDPDIISVLLRWNPVGLAQSQFSDMDVRKRCKGATKTVTRWSS